MPGFFEAFGNIKPATKKHTVTIQEKVIEVTLEKKLEIQRAGEDKYMLEGSKIILRPRKKTNRRFPVLEQDGIDPYWIATDEGIKWRTE